MIVTFKAKPIICQATIGGALHPISISDFVNILDTNLTPNEACEMPHFQFIDYKHAGVCFPKKTQPLLWEI